MILVIANVLNYFFNENPMPFASVTGAIIGLITVVIIPILLDIVFRKRKEEAKNLIVHEWSKINAFKYDKVELNEQNFSIRSLILNNSNEHESKEIFDTQPSKSNNILKELVLIIIRNLIRVIILLIGIFTIIIQFYQFI